MTEMEKAFIRNWVEQKAERCAYARVFDRETDEVFVERLKAEFSAVMWLAIELGVLDEEEAERMLKEKERAWEGVKRKRTAQEESS